MNKIGKRASGKSFSTNAAAVLNNNFNAHSFVVWFQKIHTATNTVYTPCGLAYRVLPSVGLQKFESSGRASWGISRGEGRVHELPHAAYTHR